ncbi:hypothetical protein ACX0G7_12235 [Flavitalea antarctica]
MKKCILIMVALLPALMLFSQNDIVITGSKKITKELTPKQVIDSLNKKFPDAKSVEYFQAPASGVQNGWTITEEDNTTSSDEVDYYTISFKRDGLKYYGLYKKDGTLLQSKVEESVKTLPEPIQASIKTVSQDHPGYTIKKQTFYRNQNYAKTKEYYEIVAEKGKTVKRLYYQADGTLVKVKG